jgi:hypothetical protein
MPPDALIKRKREETRLRRIQSQKSFLAKQGISVREGAVIDPTKEGFDYGEYQKAQAIKTFTFASPSIPSRRKQGDAIYAQSKQKALQAQYNRILAQQRKFSPTREAIAEAQAGGADPRTIAAYVSEGDRLTGEYRRILSKASGPGAVGSMYRKRADVIKETGRDAFIGSFFGGKRVEEGKGNLSLLQEDITTRAKSEGVVQRATRRSSDSNGKSLIQGQQQRFEQRSGRRALLSSTAGGAGFLQGYFR